MNGLITSLGITVPVQAAGIPLVIGATVNYTQKTQTIAAQNFGGSPKSDVYVAALRKQCRRMTNKTINAGSARVSCGMFMPRKVSCDGMRAGGI